jgi:hypothetical protein
MIPFPLGLHLAWCVLVLHALALLRYLSGEPIRPADAAKVAASLLPATILVAAVLALPTHGALP